MRRFCHSQLFKEVDESSPSSASSLPSSLRLSNPRFMMDKAAEVSRSCKFAVLSTLDVYNFPIGDNDSNISSSQGGGENQNNSNSNNINNINNSNSKSNSNNNIMTRRISSRTVQPFSIEFEAGSPVIYFNSNNLGRKCVDMAANPYVSLVYLNEQDMSCASFMGTVERVPYPESTMGGHWASWLYMFYPEGPDESKVC
jgi:hypothetical protein